MTTAPSNMASGSSAPAAGKQAVLNEIRAKWGKFSDQELSGLKGRDDLVTQVASKYGTDKGQAQRDVDALLKDRQI